MKTLASLSLIALCAVVTGCSNSETPDGTVSSAQPTGTQYIAATEPANATPVGDARQQSKDGDAVTLLGRIGGSAEPFVDGLAAFTIVDPKVAWCPPEEGCPTPWDYCCTQNEVRENIATVKVVDDQGKAVAEDAKQLLGVKELSLVVVEGTAQRDDEGNLSVLANKVFIRPDN
ncbi:MAG: hypothetical protein ACR2NP_09990 [Pirellulaceae bacterium]